MVTVCRNAYWGEYPLSFAACLGQEECVRLLCAKKADVNKKDTNGNTALHMLVIHDKEVDFNLCQVSKLSFGRFICQRGLTKLFATTTFLDDVKQF